MLCSGYVLVGGGSTRMGRDKALLPYRGTLLIKHIAAEVERAAGNLTLIGDPARYSSLGYAVHADEVPHCGPLGGVLTALLSSATDWNLIVACDMPDISEQVLRDLLGRAAVSDRRVVAAMGTIGDPEPLCAAYHRDCIPVLAHAIRDKRFRMKDLIRELDAESVAVDPLSVTNVNTAAEWLAR